LNFDLISSSVTSIEGYNYCAVLTDDCSEYRWAYALKTKDEFIDVVKQWYAEIADLREKYQLLVVMRDFAGHEIQEFFTNKGVKSYFSTPNEPWQDGLGEAGIKSVLLRLLARTEMAESGLAGRYWFSAVNHGKNCRNVTFKYRLGTTPYAQLYGMEKNVSKFRPFGCKAYVHLNKERREKGKHTPRAVEAIHLGFAPDCNMSAYKLYIPSSAKCIVSNQARFDEESFPYRNQDMIRGKLEEDNNLEILSVDKLPTRRIDFTPEINLDQYEKLHVGNGEHFILRSKTEQDVYMKVSREAFFQSLLQRNSNELLSKARGLLSRMEAELVNTPVGGPSRVKGLPDSIDPNKPLNSAQLSRCDAEGGSTGMGGGVRQRISRLH
jgi:hypothetical protein